MSKVIFVLIFVSPFAQAQNMQPGLWKATSSLELNGLPLPASEGEECITKAATKDTKATISKELGKRGCTLTKWNLRGKKLEAALKCQKDDLEAEGTLSGTVTPKSYDLKGKAEGSYKMIPSVASLNLRGSWVRDCKN